MFLRTLISDQAADALKADILWTSPRGESFTRLAGTWSQRSAAAYHNRLVLFPGACCGRQ